MDVQRPVNLDLAIIGAGPAGLAAAIAARKQGCKKLAIFERDRQPGGILKQCIHNGFGLHYFREELTGPEYAARFAAEIEELAIPLYCDTMVIGITERETGLYLITTVNPQRGLQKYYAKAIVLAMGCRERPRGALGIPGSRCAGIMTTGTAQRLVNLEGLLPGKRIVILGSGDIGLIMARRMTYEGAEVLACLEIMPYSGGLTRNIVQCLHDYDIPLLLNHTIVEIEGKDRVTAVKIAAVDAQTLKPILTTVKRIECDTLLLSVGLIPENELSRQLGLELDPNTQGLQVNQHMLTEKAGVFACGNLLHVHDLVDYVTLEGEKAGTAAWEYVLSGKRKSSFLEVAKKQIALVAGQGVRSIAPQRLEINLAKELLVEPLNLFYRSDSIYRQATIRVLYKDQILITQKKKIVTPGEMGTIRIKKDVLAQLVLDFQHEHKRESGNSVKNQQVNNITKLKEALQVVIEGNTI